MRVARVGGLERDRPPEGRGILGIRILGVPKIRALFETTYLAGLRKAGMPEE